MFVRRHCFFEPTLDLDLTLRSSDQLGISGNSILGDPAIHLENPERINLALPDGYWELAAIPMGGWRAHDFYIWLARLSGAVVILLAGPLGYLRSSQARERREHSQLYRLLTENAPEALLVLNAEQDRFIDANRNTETLFKLDQATLLENRPEMLDPQTLLSTIKSPGYQTAPVLRKNWLGSWPAWCARAGGIAVHFMDLDHLKIAGFISSTSRSCVPTRLPGSASRPFYAGTRPSYTNAPLPIAWSWPRLTG